MAVKDAEVTAKIESNTSELIVPSTEIVVLLLLAERTKAHTAVGNVVAQAAIARSSVSGA